MKEKITVWKEFDLRLLITHQAINDENHLLKDEISLDFFLLPFNSMATYGPLIYGIIYNHNSIIRQSNNLSKKGKILYIIYKSYMMIEERWLKGLRKAKVLNYSN